MMRCSRLPPLASPVFNAFRQCWIPAISISHNLNLHSASIYASFSSYVSKSFKHVKPLWIRPMSLHRPSFKVTASFSSAGGSEDGRELLVQHLLVKEDDIKLLSELQQRIAGGEDLSDLAVEYSLCPSKEEGGMLGWVRKGQMVPEFEEAAFNAPLNKVVKCKTKFGWHLLQVLSEREGSVLLDIQPEELHLKMQDSNFLNDAQLIDVREPEEVDQASLPAFQVLPLRQFGSWGPEVATKFDPQKDIRKALFDGFIETQPTATATYPSSRSSAMGNCCSRENPEEAPATSVKEGSNDADNSKDDGGNTNHGNSINNPSNKTPPSASPAASTKPSKQSQIGTVLGRPMEDVRSTYSIGKELGRGQFGVTHLCTHKASGEHLACKTIAKRKLVNKEDIEDVRREVQIMHHLTGQPNIVELKGAYEDKHSVHLVMELCAGGELFDRIIAKGHYTERAAASLLRTIVQIVHTCHSMGVIHRDLKPENFLLLSKDEDSPLKATDFGLSVFYKQGEVFKDIVGSAYYIAPEVLKRRYGPEVDIWSVGVMLYILLCGVPPFWAESEHGIFNAILRGHIDFTSDPWPTISPAAKDLVRKMLNSDPKQRLSAFQVLNHPWIKEDGEAPDTPLDNAVLNRLKQFRAMNKFKKVALRVIAGCLSEEEIMGLKQMFKSMDTDNSGTITLEELKQGLAKQGTKLSEYEVKQLMEAADADGNGTIDYDEFITATMHLNRMDREEHLYTAFQYFDKDNSGFITTEELEQALREYGMHDGRDIKEILSEVDGDNDGHINYDEFVAMMRKGNPEANPKKRRDVFV